MWIGTALLRAALVRRHGGSSDAEAAAAQRGLLAARIAGGLLGRVCVDTPRHHRRRRRPEPRPAGRRVRLLTTKNALSVG